MKNLNTFNNDLSNDIIDVILIYNILNLMNEMNDEFFLIR